VIRDSPDVCLANFRGINGAGDLVTSAINKHSG
jgi:hypothetical protein